jgi:hypothetical protein
MEWNKKHYENALDSLHRGFLRRNDSLVQRNGSGPGG